jgi:hypothetical protein
VRRWWPLLALLVVTAAFVILAAVHDFRSEQPRGDQTAHVQLALSIAYDSHTLNFDRFDAQRWRELGWPAAPVPMALFFQRYKDGWAASKPYGYPLAMAPFVAALGPRGLDVGNAVLLLALVLISFLLALRRFDVTTAALLVGAFYFASLIYLYAYPIMTELFEALLALLAFGGAYMFHRSGKVPWVFATFAVMAFGVVEKAAFLVLCAPLAALMLWELRRRRGVLIGALAFGVLAVAVSVAPYLKYSDANSFTPYAGERYQVKPVPTAREPWVGGRPGTDYYPVAVTEGNVLDNIVSGKVSDRFQSAAYYFVGRYTGVLVTVPLALLLLVALLVTLPKANRWGVAALLGVLFYIGFYVLVFPKNYYGGGQSIGDRYFVQMAPAILVAALFSPIGARAARWLAVAAIGLSLILTLPLHRDPSGAYADPLRTTAIQRLLPLETNQDYTWFLKGDPPPAP